MNARLALVATRAAVLLAVGTIAAAQNRATVVTVYEEIQRGRTIYHYTVTNNGDRPVTILTIGRDPDTGDWQLTAAPTGWTRDRGLLPSSAAAPAGWTTTVYTEEDSDKVAIEWRTASHRSIAPHQTVGGFRVVLPRPTDTYTSAGWETINDLGGATRGTLERRRQPK